MTELYETYTLGILLKIHIRKELTIVYVIRSKSGMRFETTEIGKTGEQTYETLPEAEKALHSIEKLFITEKFVIESIRN